LGTVSNPLDAAFDMVNEVHFGTQLLRTRARLVRLVEDTRLVDGDDLNDDGVADVSAKLTQCQQVRGRTVFPAGFYRAGTILDVDLQWDTDSYPLGVRDADLANTRIFDFQGIATHEFGHALGLAHSLHTQRSSHDGRDAIMGGSFARDPVFKRMQRTLDSDDIAWASYLYPEGSASAGPAALQPGDVAFTRRYGLITGTLRHGASICRFPVARSLPRICVRAKSCRAAIQGTVRFSGNPVTGEIHFLPAEQGIVDGRFVIPLPAGSYALTVRPTGLPPYPISYTNDAGASYGLLDFHEEGVDRHDDDVEYRPGDVKPFRVLAGRTIRDVRIVTNRTIDVTQVGPFDTMTVAALETPEGLVPFRYEAVRIPAARYAELTQSRAMPVLAALFLTQPADPSAVQRFPGAMLTTGTVNADGSASVNLASPLVRIGPIRRPGLPAHAYLLQRLEDARRQGEQRAFARRSQRSFPGTCTAFTAISGTQQPTAAHGPVVLRGAGNEFLLFDRWRSVRAAAFLRARVLVDRGGTAALAKSHAAFSSGAARFPEPGCPVRSFGTSATTRVATSVCSTARRSPSSFGGATSTSSSKSWSCAMR
jgi:hypothetical protein